MYIEKFKFFTIFGYLGGNKLADLTTILHCLYFGSVTQSGKLTDIL